MQKLLLLQRRTRYSLATNALCAGDKQFSAGDEQFGAGDEQFGTGDKGLDKNVQSTCLNLSHTPATSKQNSC